MFYQALFFSALKQIQPGVGGEIQLTDGIATILDCFEFRAHHFEGTRYDCGNKLGHLKANMVYAFKDPALAGTYVNGSLSTY